jgi:hypothetical protein
VVGRGLSLLEFGLVFAEATSRFLVVLGGVLPAEGGVEFPLRPLAGAAVSV